MSVIAFGNQKGGVGKTTTTLGIADALTQTGAKVLVIDLDPQASATWSVGVEPGAQPGIDELLDEPDAGLEAAAVSTDWGFDIIPSVTELAQRERSARPADEFVLRDVVQAEHAYDYVLIDCPPSLGLLTLFALVAADGVVLVTDATFSALKGVEDFVDTIERVGRYNPTLSLWGVIVNRYSRLIEQEAHLGELRGAFEELVWNPIVPQAVAAQAAASAGKPPSSLRRRGARRLAVAYSELAQRIQDQTQEHAAT